MPLPAPPPESPGGVLYLEYVNPTAGERHTLRLHLAWFDQAAVGSLNDHAYVSGGPVAPTETSLADTYAALAALWAPYYTPEWTLHVDSLGFNAGGIETVLDPGPLFDPQVGTAAPPDGAVWYLDRRFRLLGHKGARRELFLAQVPSTVLRPQGFEVTATSGGLDARDRAWMNYLAGHTGGAVVMPDGTYSFPVTDMVVWWARRPEPASWVLPGAPYIVSGP